MLQGLKMKKLLFLTLPAMFACGTDTSVQTETFAAQEISVPRSAVCENMDASVRQEMDAGEYEKLCGHPKLCEDFETEMVCDGEWCVIHKTCRLH
tara:strand:+ start:161 stop:445 length:285 start_codon:yes stop_codon:yes gene_type:complete